MSSNRFLSPKGNNRFNFLKDDDYNIKSSLKNKSNKNHLEYEPSQNSFTRPSQDRNNRNTNRDTNRDTNRNTNRDNRDYNRINNFKTERQEQLPKTQVDFNDTTLFPELVKKNNTNKENVESSINFKDVLNITIEDTTEKKDEIPPGWLQMSMVDRKVVLKNGPPIKDKREKEEPENDINYDVSKVIEILRRNYEEYEKNYDSINGEGSYIERFRLSPVYGSEYDTEIDDYSDDNNDNNDYDYDYDEMVNMTIN